jgi:hypothetical protein
MVETAGSGRIAARIDRLQLTWFGGYETLLLRGFGLTSEHSLRRHPDIIDLGGGGGLAICAALGEAVERRMIILISAA